jgi:hypothetical protein
VAVEQVADRVRLLVRPGVGWPELLAAFAALLAARLVWLSVSARSLLLPPRRWSGGIVEMVGGVLVLDVVMVVLAVGIPLVGAALLLSRDTGRREVGAAIAAVFGLLLVHVLVPEVGLRRTLVWMVPPLAGLLGLRVLLRSPSVRWAVPRDLPRSALAGALLAYAVTAVPLAFGARDVFIAFWPAGVPATSVWLLTVAAVGVAAAGVRPVRVAAAAGAVLAAISLLVIARAESMAWSFARGGDSVVFIDIGARLDAVTGFTESAWFWPHVAACALLLVAVYALWRSRPSDEPGA